MRDIDTGGRRLGSAHGYNAGWRGGTRLETQGVGGCGERRVQAGMGMRDCKWEWGWGTGSGGEGIVDPCSVRGPETKQMREEA